MNSYESYMATPESHWYSELPVSWKSQKLKTLFAERRTTVSDKDYPALSVGKVGIVPQLETAVKTNDGNKRKLICAGDFAINSRSDRKGACGISEHTGSCSLIITVLRPHSELNNHFFHYLLRSHFFSEEFYRNGFGIVSDLWTTRWKNMRNIPVPVPPREEQEKIVRFLDWKVSAIDKLIAKHKERIALLDELKGTLIDKAVILGIKDFEAARSKKARWEIPCPKHWKIQRMRESFTFRKGLTITKDNLEESGIPVINYGQIHAKDNSGIGLNNNLLRYVNESYLESNPAALVEHGDFIFADTSEDVASCGNCVYIDRQETIFAGYHSIIAHPTTAEANHKYLAYLFQSATWRDQLRKQVNGVKVYSITQKLLKDASILLPPLDEQNVIVAHLDSVCQKIRAGTDKLNLKIRYLQDLKPRLISDAVTGKIDVRSIKLPNFAKEE